MSRLSRFAGRVIAQLVLDHWAKPVTTSRPPDHVIWAGDRDDPYMMRWYAIPRNPIFNIYFNKVLRSDDDRAHHDHPWLWNASLGLQGCVIEHIIKQGGIEVRRPIAAGIFVFRAGGEFAHRLSVIPFQDQTYMSMFITGPRYRKWGFHCPERGWVYWKDFTKDNGSDIGRGCD